MDHHLYLSLLPEALIVSQLTPEQFGTYYAVGSAKKSRGQAMFFEVDPDYRNDYFHMEEALARCKPHEDGSPKASIYVSVYRVLEHIDPDALREFYLVTQDGRSLAVKPSDAFPVEEESLHLYQEISPVSPLVVSRLGPVEFFDLIVKNPTSLVTVPAIVFAELDLEGLATDPEWGLVDNLPYANIDHLRQCLSEVKTKFASTKMVDRNSSPNIHYRTLKNGFFVGNKQKLRYYPMPDADQLRAENYRWFRSANM